MPHNLLLDLVNQYGYLGVFLISLLSNGTFIFPVPYLIVIYYIGASRLLDPLLVAIMSGIGATLGELSLYFLTMLGRVILPPKYKMRIESVKQAIDRYGPAIIFIFALTPLPDDVIYPVLGIMKYNFLKVFISCFLGKAILSGIVVYAGYYSAEYIAIFLGGESFLSSLIAILLGILITIIVLKVDWTKYFNVEEVGRR